MVTQSWRYSENEHLTASHVSRGKKLAPHSDCILPIRKLHAGWVSYWNHVTNITSVPRPMKQEQLASTSAQIWIFIDEML